MSGRTKNAEARTEGPRKNADKRQKRRLVDSDHEAMSDEENAYTKRARVEERMDVEADSEQLGTASSKTKAAKKAQSKRLRKPNVHRIVDGTYEDVEEDAILSDYPDDIGEDLRASKSSKGGKGKGPAKGPKAKSAKPELNARDERKGLTSVSSLKRPRPTLDISIGAAPGSAVSTPAPSASVDEVPVSSIPPVKKTKLPTIKKNKPPVTPSAVTTKQPLPPQISAETSISATSISRTPAANIGVADFDLRNKNVYNALFNTTASSRSGQKEEERRKELNKLRDEARLKRNQEANTCFDLQLQTEKIQHFEDILREHNSAALFPNYLAAKWMQVDRETKHRLKQDSS